MCDQNITTKLKLLEPNVIIGLSVQFGEKVWVRYGSKIVESILGNMVFIGFNCRIENTVIGNHCQIATNVSIGKVSFKKTIIADNVWIGARAYIAPGVKIGKNAIIGAGAYVTNDILENSVIVGRPGKILRKRIFTDDLNPDFTALLVKNIAKHISKNTSLSEKNAVSGGYIDADIKQSTDSELEANLIIIGRKDGPSREGGLTLGENVRIQKGGIIEAAGGINIGDNSVIEEDVLLISSTHDMNYKSLPWKAAKINIGKGVLIGKGSTIIGPAYIHDDCVILPNSVLIGREYFDKYIYGVFH